MIDKIYDICPRPYLRRTFKGRFTDAAKAYHGYLELLKWNHFEYREGWGITFVMPIPPTWSKGKVFEYDGYPVRQKKRNDLDNLLKAVLDSLPEDDGLISEFGPMRKIWGKTGKIIVRMKTCHQYFEEG